MHTARVPTTYGSPVSGLNKLHIKLDISVYIGTNKLHYSHKKKIPQPKLQVVIILTQ